MNILLNNTYLKNYYNLDHEPILQQENHIVLNLF